MFKKFAVLTAFLETILACGLLAAAQEVRSEFTVSGTGLFTKDSNNNGLQHKATQTGGALAGLRFNINRWSAFEMNYGWNRNSQQFFTAGGLPTDRIQSNIHQLTADFVGKIPTRGHFRPYVLAGGGALIFDPVQRSLPLISPFMTIPAGTRVPTRAQGAFVYGAGTDIDLGTRGHGRAGVALRLGYRGYVYDVPDFGFSKLDLKTVTHTAQPEAGLTFRF